jgi:hypothetical protein
MKKLVQFVAVAMLVSVGSAGVMSFTTPTSTPVSVADNIQFKLINDTQNDIDYCVNDTHYVIKKDESVGFSFAAGTVVKKYSDNKCGEQWFKISADKHGTSIKVSEVK